MDTQTTFVYPESQIVNNNGMQYGLELDDEKIELIRRTIARGATNDELALFVEQCRRTGLDPFARQIYSVRRKQWNAQSRSYEEAQIIQVSIDGFRLTADRTHKYAGQVGPWWCGPDGEWKEVWLNDDAPSAAKVGVLRHDFHQPLFAIALFKSYVQTNAHGEPVSRWKTDPAGMLAKCAEALALRRAFPQELSGLYTTEEMGQADNPANGNLQIPNTAVRTEAPAPVMDGSRSEAEIEPSETEGDNTAFESNDATVESPPARRTKRSRASSTQQRPFTPAELRANFTKAVAAIEAKGLLLGPDDFAITHSAFGNLLESARDRERYLEFVTGIPYLEDLNETYVVALLRLLKPTNVDGVYLPSEEALSEAMAVINWLDEDNGTVVKDE